MVHEKINNFIYAVNFGMIGTGVAKAAYGVFFDSELMFEGLFRIIVQTSFLLFYAHINGDLMKEDD